MNLDLSFQKGSKGKPALIFIHGLGMDKKIWENPSESRILGGSLPINTLLSREPVQKDFGYHRKKPAKSFPSITTGIRPYYLKTLFEDMKLKRYPVITWSQNRPVGPVDVAVSELIEIINFTAQWNKNGFILIGHSRGGLIARKYLMRTDKRIKGLITICTPNRGSSIAKLATHISPLTSKIAPLFAYRHDMSIFKKVVKRIMDFLESTAVRELLPDSDFFKSLNDKKVEGIYYMNIGGTSPSLFSLYRWKWETAGEGAEKRWLLIPKKIISAPDILEKIIPGKFYPKELRKGMGDGLVTEESSKIEWCSNHHSFPLNHAEMLFDKNVRKIISKAVDSIL
jgi:pimeloyl-ACP methyl ester carboxylesterase